MGGKAYIFLNGHYPKEDQQLIRGLVRTSRPRPLLMAVDGGLAMLLKLSIKPDYWISDLDSAPKVKRGYLTGIEVYLYPPDKEKTDAELAVDLCARLGVRDITFFGWDVRQAETDHLLGTLFLSRNLKGRKGGLSLRYLSTRQEIAAVKDATLIYRGYKGRRLSIIPMSARISLTLAGTEFPARKLTIREGETTAMRNQITSRRASVTVKGMALAITTQTAWQGA